MKKTKGNPKRTILEFLLKLPEPFREQAIKNAADTANKNFKGRTIKDALKSAFIWNESPEGGDYWNEFTNNYLL